MKVLMLSGDVSAIKGEQGPFYTTLLGLSEHWQKIDVICPWTEHGPQKNQLFDNVCLWSKPISKIMFPFTLESEFSKDINFSDYDLIVSHDYGFMMNGVAAYRLSKKYKIPYISEIHHIEGYPIASNLKERIYRLAARFYLNTFAKNALGLRIVNEKQMRPLLEQLGYPANKIHYIPSMYIDFEVFKPLELEKEYDAFFCGRLAQNKGIFQILEALIEVKKNHPDYQLLIKGTGPLEKEIQKYIDDHQLQKNVTLIKWVDTPEDLTKLYNKSKVLICSSTAEGGPRVTLEAMACEVPVISTPVGLMPELIDSGKNGFLYNWDKNELVKLMDLFRDSSKDFSELASLGRDSISNFAKETTLKNYATQYQKLIGRESL